MIKTYDTEMYRVAGEAAPAIVQVLEEARQRRRLDTLHSCFCSVTNTCEQKWQIWPSTSTGTMVFCWSCKQSWNCNNANPPVAGQGLTRSQNSCRIEFSSKNGREISSSVFGTTRWPQLYILADFTLRWVPHSTNDSNNSGSWRLDVDGTGQISQTAPRVIQKRQHKHCAHYLPLDQGWRLY